MSSFHLRIGTNGLQVHSFDVICMYRQLVSKIFGTFLFHVHLRQIYGYKICWTHLYSGNKILISRQQAIFFESLQVLQVWVYVSSLLRVHLCCVVGFWRPPLCLGSWEDPYGSYLFAGGLLFIRICVFMFKFFVLRLVRVKLRKVMKRGLYTLDWFVTKFISVFN